MALNIVMIARTNVFPTAVFLFYVRVESVLSRSRSAMASTTAATWKMSAIMNATGFFSVTMEAVYLETASAME